MTSRLFNPPNAKATFVQRKRTQRCWYSLDSSQMSTFVPGFQSFLEVFLHHFVFAKLATSSTRVKGLPETIKNVILYIVNEVVGNILNNAGGVAFKMNR